MRFRTSERSPKHLGQKVKEPRIDVDFLAKHLSSVFLKGAKNTAPNKTKHQRNLFSHLNGAQPVFFLQGDPMILDPIFKEFSIIQFFFSFNSHPGVVCDFFSQKGGAVPGFPKPKSLSSS